MDVDKAKAVVGGFVDAGGTLIDASISTNQGHAQALLGEVLAHHNRDELVVTAAAGVRPEAPVGMRVDCSRKALLSSLDRSLGLLRTDHVDVFSVEFWDELTPPSEVQDTLTSIVASGKARYAGVRGYAGWQVAVTDCPAVIVAQNEYNLLDRSAEQELLPATQHLGVGFIAASSLAHGILTGKYRSGATTADAEVHTRLDERSARIVEALGTAAAGLGMSPVTAALAWAQGRPGVSSTLVSVTEARQWDDILAATQQALPTAIVAALDDISAL